MKWMQDERFIFDITRTNYTKPRDDGSLRYYQMKDLYLESAGLTMPGQ